MCVVLKLNPESILRISSPQDIPLPDPPRVPRRPRTLLGPPEWAQRLATLLRLLNHPSVLISKNPEREPSDFILIPEGTLRMEGTPEKVRRALSGSRVSILRSSGDSPFSSGDGYEGCRGPTRLQPLPHGH